MNTFKPVQQRDPDEGSELLEWLAKQPHRNQGKAMISQGPEIPGKSSRKNADCQGDCRILHIN